LSGDRAQADIGRNSDVLKSWWLSRQRLQRRGFVVAGTALVRRSSRFRPRDEAFPYAAQS
jgi:hypothetical protein